MHVLIVDDHAVVRAGFGRFLSDSMSVQIGEAASGEDALAQLRDGHWDLLIMDIHLPGLSGLDVLKLIAGQYPKLAILILSGLPEEQYARNVIRAGAGGYVSKSCTPDTFLLAVHTVMRGQHYVSPALAESIITQLQGGTRGDGPLHSILSSREFQVFCKLAVGGRPSAVAKELSLHVKTVSTYRARILEKMNFSSNADITSYALRHGLIV